METLVAANLTSHELAPQIKSHHSVVVCIPALNEARIIGSVVRAAKRYSNCVLVCDDGSTDNTSEEASLNGALLFKHPKSMGKGAALRTLFREASKLAPDVVITLDGDGQHDPADIPNVVVPILDGSADLVIGSRFTNGNRIPFHRVLGNSVLNLLTNLAAKTLLKDTQSGFRAYSSKVASSLSIDENGMGVDSEILMGASRIGCRIAERNVKVTYGKDTSTFNPFNHTFQVLSALVRSQARHSRIPGKMLAWFLVVAAGLMGILELTSMTGASSIIDRFRYMLPGIAGIVIVLGLSDRPRQRKRSNIA